MTDYLTNDTDLTSVAAAIRAKGGTSALLTYPSGFITAIQNIPTGTLSAYAYIVVEYPSDATSVTCTNTDDSIQLSSTMKLFLVSDNASSCVVTISKTNNTVSKTIAVASGGSYYVLMMFMHRFVYNGVIQGSDMTRVGLKDESASYNQQPTVTYATGYVEILAGGSGTYNGAGIAYFPEKIDLTKYSTIHVQGTARNNTGTNGFCAVDAWTAIGSTQADNRLLRTSLLSSSTSSYTSFDITADVSTYTSEAYIGFNVRRNGSGYSGIRITEAWID